MLCLSCGVSSMPGSTYCIGCGKSLNYRICNKGHKNPLSNAVKRCGECGSQALSDGTPAITLTGISRIISWAVVLSLLFWALHHLFSIASWCCYTLFWCIRNIVKWNEPYFSRYVGNAVVWILMVWILSFLLPHEYGAKLRRLMWDLLISSIRFVARLLPKLASLIYRLIEGSNENRGKRRRK